MTALALKDLCKAFGGLQVTRNVNLSVEPGERRLIIGPNGAGKTTLFNQITGDLRPSSGSIHVFGRDITRIASRQRAHIGIARTYQIITLFARDTLLRNVMLALLGLSPLRWNPFVDLERQEHLRERAKAALARVGLAHIASGGCPRPPTASGGASRSPWRWRRSRSFSCSTSPSPVCRRTSGATCAGCWPGFRARSPSS